MMVRINTHAQHDLCDSSILNIVLGVDREASKVREGGREGDREGGKGREGREGRREGGREGKRENEGEKKGGGRYIA